MELLRIGHRKVDFDSNCSSSSSSSAISPPSASFFTFTTSHRSINSTHQRFLSFPRSFLPTPLRLSSWQQHRSDRTSIYALTSERLSTTATPSTVDRVDFTLSPLTFYPIDQPQSASR
ncbi:uncharacterized protein UDID_19087 [Ustilago sp. UG-2017a]|nr:uncharacterized protein UDID_19087 [Ustilago sp. UG-2017a]